MIRQDSAQEYNDGTANAGAAYAPAAGVGNLNSGYCLRHRWNY